MPDYYNRLKLKTLLTGLLLCLLCAGDAQAQTRLQESGKSRISAGLPAPVVVELFSSQACTFCPPADRFMGSLAKQTGLIALSCHVDYFDVKDGSLSREFCTKRQTDYLKILDVPTHYTPQMVVNGHMDVIGYESDKVRAAILKARAEKIGTVKILAGADGAYRFSLPEKDLEGRDIRLWQAVFDKPHEMTITEGGNLGKKMRYYNVISRLKDIGPWTGAALTRSVYPSFREENAGMAIFAQDRKNGRIIAAGAVYTQ
ncbi:MAG: DUF1223 domain-containing protein [Rhodospirillales bacterium]|nr:DUF1223 domain-containing protein [Alphaproteobacteria bacterium]USO04412.1 MAG: DUF1223 domain-containing protein [Rhodospirillales bacterium]